MQFLKYIIQLLSDKTSKPYTNGGNNAEWKPRVSN